MNTKPGWGRFEMFISNSTLNSAIKIGALAAPLCLVASIASAATYNFGGSGGLGESETFLDTFGVTSLTAKAINTEQPPSPTLTQTSNGIGVKSGFFDSGQVDNIGDDEAVVFDFGGQALWSSISLSVASFFDDYRIYGSNDSSVLSCTTGGLTCLTSVSSLLASGSGSGLGGSVNVGLSSSPFQYLIATTPGGAGDGYRISSLDAIAAPMDATPVPLPAALPLLAGGLGLMGFVGRRRNRKAASA